MPKTTLKSKKEVTIFIVMLLLSWASLYILNNGIDISAVHYEVQRKPNFNHQLGIISVLSMLWFGLLAVKKKPKAVIVGLAVALVNSFSTFMLIGKLKIAYGVNLPFDAIALVACIVMVFVLNKRYFSRIIG
ncbi:MAG: hypothetical protein ACJA0Q_001184 [Saprospiraceae bacterium]|jgi:hypothetical protein